MPSSIFDLRFYSRLLNWHNKYGAVFTMYVFERADDFHISDVPYKYYKELHDSAGWLKWGFHDISKNTSAKNDDDFKRSFESTCRAISEFAGESAISDCLRLHRFECEPNHPAILRTGGVSSLLCSDDDKLSYDLTPEENCLLSQNGYFIKGGMKYQKTHFRYETIEDTTAIGNFSASCQPLVIFGHEWSFDKCSGKIDETIGLLEAREYTFCH